MLQTAQPERYASLNGEGKQDRRYRVWLMWQIQQPKKVASSIFTVHEWNKSQALAQRLKNSSFFLRCVSGLSRPSPNGPPAYLILSRSRPVPNGGLLSPSYSFRLRRRFVKPVGLSLLNGWWFGWLLNFCGVRPWVPAICGDGGVGG